MKFYGYHSNFFKTFTFLECGTKLLSKKQGEKSYDCINTIQEVNVVSINNSYE